MRSSSRDPIHLGLEAAAQKLLKLEIHKCIVRFLSSEHVLMRQQAHFVESLAHFEGQIVPSSTHVTDYVLEIMKGPVLLELEKVHWEEGSFSS